MKKGALYDDAGLNGKSQSGKVKISSAGPIQDAAGSFP